MYILYVLFTLYVHIPCILKKKLHSPAVMVPYDTIKQIYHNCWYQNMRSGFSAESYNTLIKVISRHWVYVLIDQQDKCSRQGHIMVTVTYRHLIIKK